MSPPARPSRTGERGRSLPACAQPGRGRRAVLRGLRCRPGPAAARRPPGPRGGPPSRRHAAPAGSAAATSPTTATAPSAGRRRRARATTSPSSRPRGWQPCATAASATPATRTPSPWTPGPSRAATRSSSSATGSPPRPTRTSPASRRPAPPATSWPPPTPGGIGHRRQRGSRRARKALVAAADAANEAVIAHTAAGPGNPASCTFVAAVVDGAALVVGLGRRQPGLLAARRRRTPRLLTTDDSFAAEQIAAGGAPRRGGERAAGPRDHPVARHRRPRPHPAHGVARPRRPGLGPGLLRRAVELLLRGRTTWPPCWSTTRPHGGRRPAPRWPAPSSTGPTPRAARTTSPWPSPASTRPRTPHCTAQPIAAASSRAHREEVSPMATFSADVYQNEFLPDGGTDVHAIVTVDLLRRGRGRAVRVGRRRRDRHRRHLRLDGRREHRGRPAGRRGRAGPGARRRVVRGRRRQPPGAPGLPAGGRARMVRMDAGSRAPRPRRGRPASAPTAARRWAPG